MNEPEIRPLTSTEEFEEVIRIQKRVWSHGDLDLTPPRLLHITVHTGAILLGAFDGGEMAGFVYSFPGVVKGRRTQHSLQLAVLPQYRGRKIGKMLKWSQRKAALESGYNLITWTTDPLLAKNANLNIHTLGAVVQTYYMDFYSSVPSLALAEKVPIDRFLIEWPIREQRVIERCRGIYPEWERTSLPAALESRIKDGVPLPHAADDSLSDELIRIDIPQDIRGYGDDPRNIILWSEAVRKLMPHYFARDYCIIDFIYGRASSFILAKRESGVF